MNRNCCRRWRSHLKKGSEQLVCVCGWACNASTRITENITCFVSSVSTVFPDKSGKGLPFPMGNVLVCDRRREIELSYFPVGSRGKDVYDYYDHI